MDKLTRQQEDIICKLLHYSRSEEVTQFILRTIGKENWTRDILSSCASELTEEQEDFQASVGYGYTSEELDEHFYIDDVNFAIAERLKELHITKYIYENDEYLDEIRLGNWDWSDDIDVKAIKREVSIEAQESAVLMDLHQRYDEVIDEIGIYSICKRGKWGFASYEGIEQIPPKYDLIIHSDEEDAAGADSVMSAYEKFGKYNSRMVLVAVGTNKREIDVLGLTFGQKSITGSGGYSHEDVMDVMKIMKSKKWDIEKLITHEYHLEELSKAIEKAADVDNALNVIIKFEI